MEKEIQAVGILLGMIPEPNVCICVSCKQEFPMTKRKDGSLKIKCEDCNLKQKAKGGFDGSICIGCKKKMPIVFRKDGSVKMKCADCNPNVQSSTVKEPNFQMNPNVTVTCAVCHIEMPIVMTKAGKQKRKCTTCIEKEKSARLDADEFEKNLGAIPHGEDLPVGVGKFLSVDGLRVYYYLPEEDFDPYSVSSHMTHTQLILIPCGFIYPVTLLCTLALT